MKSTLKWGAVCLVTYLLFLVAKLPATQVLSKLPLPTELQLYGVSGTIWDGQAKSISYQGLPVENIKWSLSFLPLLVGDYSLDVKAGSVRQVDKISVKGQLVFSGNQIQASDLETFIPSNLVMSMLPLPIPIEAGGRFKVKLAELDYDYTLGCNELAGSGQWLNAKVAGVNKVIQLGNFDTSLGCENSQVLLKVKEPNSFGLTAQINVPADFKVKVKGRFKPEENLPKEVHQAALFFGNPDSDGYYPIEF